jgi:hypothetical protein
MMLRIAPGWWQESPITRKSAEQPLKPSRREGRVFPANLW